MVTPPLLCYTVKTPHGNRVRTTIGRVGWGVGGEDNRSHTSQPVNRSGAGAALSFHTLIIKLINFRMFKETRSTLVLIQTVWQNNCFVLPTSSYNNTPYYMLSTISQLRHKANAQLIVRNTRQSFLLYEWVDVYKWFRNYYQQKISTFIL